MVFSAITCMFYRHSWRVDNARDCDLRDMAREWHTIESVTHINSMLCRREPKNRTRHTAERDAIYGRCAVRHNIDD